MTTINKGKHGKFRIKDDLRRFFTPSEWERFYDTLHPNHKFPFLFLFSTGMRYNEAKNVLVGDIDWQNKWIDVKKPKGGRLRKRIAHITTYFKKQLKYQIAISELKPEDNFKFPTIQGMNKTMKNTCKKIGIKDYLDFSPHNLRKTHENFLLAIDKDMYRIEQHMGHSAKTAMGHYVSGAIIKREEDKNKIRKWFGDMFE